jgi:hypothetical protein
MRPDRPWYGPVHDLDAGDGTWESMRDAEMIAQDLRIKAAAGLPPEALAKLRLNEDDLAPEDPQVIVLPDGEWPDDSMQFHTLPRGEQIPRAVAGRVRALPRRPSGDLPF